MTTPSTSAPKLPTTDANIPISPKPHTLDPANKNLLPLENALVPYQPPTNDQDINFDLMEVIADAQHDEDLVIAATQMEAKYNATKSTKATVMGARPPLDPPMHTYTNIHMHERTHFPYFVFRLKE